VVLDFIRAEDAGERYAFRFGAQEYVLRGSGGSVENVELQWSQALLADLAALHQPGCDPAVIQRVGGTLRAFLRSAEWARQEAQLLAAVSNEQPVVVTIRSAAAELYALPWELLTVGASGQHLGELPSVLVRYEWPETRTAVEWPSPRPEGGRVLFAWSAAGGQVPVSEHLRAIHEGASAGHDSFDRKGDVLERASYGRLDDVLKAAKAPGGTPISVLHLLCHGGAVGQTCGLVLNGEYDGEPAVIDAGRLRQLLAPYAGMVRLVVIAACNSGDIGTLGNQLGSVAQALHQIGIGAVIASRFPLSILGSNRFSEFFYRELFGGPSSVETAFLAARRQLARDTSRLDWASVQLYAREEDGHDSRPIVMRPYRGLLAFQPEHSRFFVGRGRLRAELKQRILEADEGKRPRFQVVAGASGSGKSSLLMAGVAPVLRSEAWAYRVMRPGDMAALSEMERLSTESPQGKLLLIVDQFEEVFTQLSQEQRERQIRRLWALAMREHSSVVVVATLRVDFLDRCGEVGLGGGLRLDTIVYDEARRLFVPQLEPGEYPEIITEPARRVGLWFEEGLVERIVADLGEEPGALPLLQYALDLLWQQRSGGKLTHEAYERITGAGGIAGALTATMDALYESLSPEEQAQTRRVLVSLVDFREDSSPYTRRRVELAAVRPSVEGGQKIFDAVVERLVQSRFIVRGNADESLERAEAVILEVAHEALIRRWERLSQWIHEDREKELQLRQLQSWTSEWTAHQKDPGYLVRGTRLGYALNLSERYANELPEEARRFVEESRRLDERRRRTTRLRLVFTVGLTAAAALVMAILWRSADEQRQRAQGLAITAAAESVRESDPTLATALLKEVKPPWNDMWTQVAMDTLQQAVAETLLKGHSEPVRVVLFSPDSTHLLTVSDSIAYIWNGEGHGKPIIFKGHSEWITSAAFNLEGTRFITGSMDGSARVWDMKNPDHPLVLGHTYPVKAVTFSASGEEVITISNDGSIRIWPLTRGGAPPASKPGFGDSGFSFATFNSARTLACVVDNKGVARIWRLDGQGEPLVKELQVPGKEILVAGFNPDGEHIITGTADGSAQFWRMGETGIVLVLDRQIYSLKETFDFRLGKVEFSRDGTQVLLGTLSHARILPANGQGDAVPVQGDGTIRTAVFSPDGAWVLTSNDDGSTRLSRVGLQSEQYILKGGCLRAGPVAFSHDSKRAIVGCTDGTARIWNLLLQYRAALPGSFERASVRFNSNGRYALTASKSSSRLWSVDDQGRLSLVRELGPVHSLLFTPDGRKFLVVEKETNPHLARIEPITGEGEPLFLDNEASIESVTFGPEDGRIATSSLRGDIRIWSVGQKAELLNTLHGHLNNVVFSPAGERILTFGSLGLRVVHVDGKAQINFPLHGETIESAEFSPKGDYILTTSRGSTGRFLRTGARLWHSDRVDDSRSVGPREVEVTGAAFSPDGNQILIVSGEGLTFWSTESKDATPTSLRAPITPFRTAFFGTRGATFGAISDDGVRLWRRGHTGDPLLMRGSATIKAAALSPDERLALTVEENGMIRSWALDEHLLAAQLEQASTVCLSTRQRQRYLDEKEQEARSRCEACEDRYKRPRENCLL
jgi:WD40 repeat protein